MKNGTFIKTEADLNNYKPSYNDTHIYYNYRLQYFIYKTLSKD